MKSDVQTTISIVIPTFNRADQLCRVLPTYLISPLVKELIIVDDGGSDGTEERVLQIANGDSRLRYIRNEKNEGAPFSRNRGASCAQGDWILQSEDDLALGENYLETLVEHAKDTGADVIAGRCIWVRLGETDDQALDRANSSRQSLFNERLLDVNGHVVTADDVEVPLLNGAMLIKSPIFQQVQYFVPYGRSNQWREESDFQLCVLEQGYKIVFCPHAITFHYSRASQSFGRDRIKGTLRYAWGVYSNNLDFLKRHSGYLSANYPKSLIFNSPLIAAIRYGIYRTAWLLAVEVMRWWRTRKHGAFSWE